MKVPILPVQFYGHYLNDLYSEHDNKVEQERKRRLVDIEYKPRSLLQSKVYRKKFWKQNEALINAAQYSTDDNLLCCFVFQNENEKREFIVTHPEDLWKDFEYILPEKRVFYELIPQNAPCFLYYDLEFEIDLNKNKDGIHMTKTLINITCQYFTKYLNYSCHKKIIINLDSSRLGKFSKHLIFSTKDVAFENNYHVGAFVKLIYKDINDFLLNENMKHDILNKFNKADLQELIITTKKGKTLFIDINIYTKNRQFRIYKATKWGKMSYLVHALDCECIWNKNLKSNELNLFLNSLVSYLPRKNKLKLLSFNQNKKLELKQSIFQEYPKSPYLELDKYISDFVKPGKIRDTKYIEKNQIIIYEILGNRYCANIGRWHKSNNIFYIINLTTKLMYQKCHDQDCAGYISLPKKLPLKVTFYFKDKADSVLSTIDI